MDPYPANPVTRLTVTLNSQNHGLFPKPHTLAPLTRSAESRKQRGVSAKSA